MRKKLIIVSIITLLSILICVISINIYVTQSVKDRIITIENANELENIDCILILGCGVREDGTPSNMLEDRLICGIELYKNNTAPKLLMTGDHGRTDYNEVGVMKQYAMSHEIDSSDIFMDHAGFSTYESIYRAKAIFGAERIVIVTQEYHLYRALYIAKELGIEAYGVSSTFNDYGGQTMRDIREIFARVKDFGQAIIKPKPTYLGEAIPISGNGNLTNDEIEV